MFNKLLIIGCGLIGSSLLRAIINKKLSKKILVYEKSKKYKKQIKKINSKIILLEKLDENIADVDFVILSTPMSVYEKIIPSLNKYLSSKTLITDIGSTKENVSKIKKTKLKKSLKWIMSHPIAGSEVSGPQYGSKNLFLNKWCIILNDKDKFNQKKLTRFWVKIGSKIITMEPNQHDKIFSMTSHLPHLIAYNLIKTALDFQKKYGKNIIQFSAGGLRDFSRTAASNEIMWRDIFFNNKKNMVQVINLFIRNLKEFKTNIIKSQNSKILKKLKNSKKVRRQIIELKQDISKPDFGRDNN